MRIPDYFCVELPKDRFPQKGVGTYCPLSFNVRIVPQYTNFKDRRFVIMHRLRIATVGFLVSTGLLLAFVAVIARPSWFSLGRGVNGRPTAEIYDQVEEFDQLHLVGTEFDALSSESNIATSQSWTRFRGPNGLGVSGETEIPTTWSDSENLAWKCELPGYGSSSPVLTDAFVFLTTYSGYGDEQRVGDIGNLKRQVVCIDRTDGRIAWTRSVDAVQPEDLYEGMGVPEHGYATNTPVTDGQNLYVFLGKSGVFAFDLEGNQIWQRSVGTDSSNRRWGSAASLILYGNLLIVNASEESRCIYGLEKATGDKIWEAQAASLELTYGTPAIAKGSEGRDELVIAVPGEIWGLNPLTGKLIWYAETSLTGNVSPSLIVDGNRLWAFGGYRSSGSILLRAGGSGNVTDTNVDWTSRDSSYVATPVLYQDKLYWIDDQGLYYCTNAESGKSLAKSRVPGIKSGGRPVYASPIAIGGKIYIQTRQSGVFVLESTEKLSIIAQNKFVGDSSVFNATPAVDRGQLFLRSYKNLYCVSKRPAL